MEHRTIHISRPVCHMDEFERKYEQIPEDDSSLWQKLCRNCECSCKCIGRALIGLLPILEVLRHYKWRTAFLGDVVSGLCLSVMHIPQSLGLATICGMPPVFGLYATFWPLAVYSFLGTSRHISVGTQAVVAVMVSQAVARKSSDWKFPANVTEEEESMLRSELSIESAMSITIACGVLQVAMFLLHLGQLVTFMSIPFISGFLAGAALHIITSQLPFIFGVEIPLQLGLTRLPRTWYQIAKVTPRASVPDLVTSLLCTIVLVFLKYCNEKYKKRMRVPMPAELIVVVIVTTASYFGDFHNRFRMRIVSGISQGFPDPQIPVLPDFAADMPDVIAIAVVSFTISMSQAKAMSHKHHYPINYNQDLFAHGAMNCVGSFFGSFAGASAPARTLVHDATGGSSQLANIVCATVVLLVILWLGSLFEALPFSVLGTVVAVAVAPLLCQVRDLPRYWRLNKYDFFVWVVTFLSVVILDVGIGLFIGMVLGVLTVVLETHTAKGWRLVQAESTGIFVPLKYYNLQCRDDESIRVFKFMSMLFFANVDTFKEQLYAQTFDPSDELAYNLHRRKQRERNTRIATTRVGADDVTEVVHRHHCMRFIVLDCSAIVYADCMGLEALNKIYNELKVAHIQLVFARCSHDLMRRLAIVCPDSRSRFFPTTLDAIILIREHDYGGDDDVIDRKALKEVVLG